MGRAPPGSGRTGSASRAFGVDSERRCALATYVNKDNNFELAEPTSRTCPHCGAHARLLPVATPSFEELIRSKPRRTGLVLRCTACNEPRFARLSVRRLGEDRIELSSTLV